MAVHFTWNQVSSLHVAVPSPSHPLRENEGFSLPSIFAGLWQWLVMLAVTFMREEVRTQPCVGIRGLSSFGEATKISGYYKDLFVFSGLLKMQFFGDMSDQSFWNNFYTSRQGNKHFDWFVHFEDVSGYLVPYLPSLYTALIKTFSDSRIVYSKS